MKKLLLSSLLVCLSVKAMDEKLIVTDKEEKLPDRFKTSHELGLAWQDGSQEKVEKIKEQWQQVMAEMIARRKQKAERKERIRATWGSIVALLQEKREINKEKQESASRRDSGRPATPHPDFKKSEKLSYAAVVAGKKASISEDEQLLLDLEFPEKKKKKNKRSKWERREQEAQQRAIVASRAGYTKLD